MSKINKIRLSGTDYDIQDVSATSVVEVTQQQYDDLPASAKTDNILYIITDSTVDYVTSAQTQYAITQAVSGKADADSVYTKTETDNALANKQTTLTAGTGIAITNNVISTTGDGNSVVELTQAAYDVLVTGGTVDPDTFYIITDAEAGDLTNYYTKTETNTLLGGKADTATTYTKTEVDNAITAATSTKQDTLISGTNIKTINNESILGSGNIDIQGGGGGKAVTGGTNISVTTGETADTINCTLNAKNGTGESSFIGNGIGGGIMNSATGNCATAFGLSNNANARASFVVGASNSSNGEYSFVGGNSSKAIGNNSFAFGYAAKAKGQYSIAIGSYYTLAENNTEVALGKANVSNTGSTDADKTLFSVGNGTSTSARHNAFEIRQNGDIYLTKDGQDVKLQDQLGGGGSSYIAGDGIDITNDVISVTGKVDTSTYNTYTAATDTALASKADTSAVTAIQDSLSGYVTTDTEQIISGRKIFTYSAGSSKAIEFKQTDDSAKVGFRVRTSAATNNELASFEFRPNTFTVDGVQHPLLYFGHYRNTNTAAAGVPQTYIGFRQYDQPHAAAYHYLIPLPEKAKIPFSLTTTFKDYYAPMGFKNGSTMITADDTGVVDLSSELGGLKLVKLSQSEYDALSPNYDSNTLYIING